MARTCQVTGARPGFGNNVSHSHRRTRRRFDVNVQDKSYWVPSLGRRVSLRLTPRAMRTIDHRGIDAVIQEMVRAGAKI
ncbi:large subunit ribosomal protein L28 [Propionibacterium cyclohexanicum]|uniref:Large ribosomal subunit protein bL28 n=1 Tax=Propionibacterium cyclohexanicum TaxID=64702 RepID=A0A1H9SPM8_9ACTN|nr:50S ribosomal protein L28 [Propionibacterium cyclohexanicum]SER86299.1 large subunit ribosomal protein L28 [Propionibacterium cyclohexanicum]